MMKLLTLSSTSNLVVTIQGDLRMSDDSVYKVIELVGTSRKSWEEAVANAVERAGKGLRNLRVAEVSKLDVTIKDGKVDTYRAKVQLSLKYEG
jgi:flavin-binding protein dodecin